ncbi:MAG: HAD-IA family hydrolase [bacterium]
MVKAVIFDVDNTLVDFNKWKDAAVEAAVMAMIDAGLNMTPDTAKEQIYQIYEEKGIEYQEVFNDFLQNVLGNIDYRILANGIIAYRRAREGALVSYPHVQIALLKLFRMGLKLAVVSDAPRLQVWMRLASLSVDRFFDVVVTFDDTGKRKPAREPFEKVLELLKVAPQEAMMVGDWAERDIVGAKELGMITVFARYGDSFGTQNSGADYEINDILEILPLIKRLNQMVND